MTTDEIIYEAWQAQTAADLAEALKIHHGMSGIDAARAVQRLEDDGLIEISRGREDGPYTFTEAGMTALGF